jgi:iron complex outermembrane recepter protein
MRRTNRSSLANVILLSAVCMSAGSTFAADESDTGSALSEIVVTAQRRSEASQDVPIAIQAFKADDLKAMGVQSTDDLPAMIPGLTLQPTGASRPIFLRGVGNNNNSNVGSAVLVFVDGVYYPYQQGTLPYNNVASVEVDKGPQGTLFGRNATGGVIQITTKDPQFTPSADVDLGYGNYRTSSASVYATTGLTDKLATDMAVYYVNQQKGWGTNLANGEDVFTNKNVALRNKWLYKFSEDTQVRVAFDYLTSAGTVGTDVIPAVGRGYLFNEVTSQKFTIPGDYNVDADYQPGYTVRQLGANVRVDTTLGDFKGVSITSWHSMRTSLYIDYDGTPIDFFQLYRFDNRNAETQEFQLISPDDSTVKWVGGLYFYNDKGVVDPFGFGGPAGNIVFGVPPGDRFNIFADDRLTSYAAFGQATVPITTDTDLTLGARYTEDQRYIDGYTAGDTAVIPGSAGAESATFKKPTYRVVVDHHFTTDILGYLSYNRGFNSGYFNQASTGGFTQAANPVVKPEIIDAYEVGTKTEFLDHRFRANASAFWYQYKDLQQQIYEGAALITVNAAAARIRGVDMDLEARPISALTVAAGVEFLDAVYLSYPNSPSYSTDIAGALVSAPGDASGNRIPYTPRWSYNVRASYVLDLPVGDFDTSAALSYTGSWYADPSNYFREPSHSLVNLSETWTASDKRNHVSLWSRNLTNKYYDVGINMLAPIGPVGNPGEPRTFGITVGHHF